MKHILAGLLPVFTVLLRLRGVGASCPNQCSDRGTCDKYSRCTCNEGFQGADCSEYICPFGLAWSDQAIATDVAHRLAECSNRGICDRSNGRCKCMEGYSGISCDRLDCPSNCNNAGVCATLLKKAEDTRDEWSRSFTYDRVWDSKKIQGCLCDPHFAGYDCSEQICPNGDDPLTKGQTNEVQVIKCLATTGNFVLYYRGYPSTSIRWDATPSEIKAALESIPIISSVNVAFSIEAATACRSTPNLISVEFTEQFGSLSPLVPLLDAQMTSSGGFIEVVADDTCRNDDNSKQVCSNKGTKEALDCAGRGICNRREGVCECFDTNGDSYASSNGYGEAGVRGDCGFAISGGIGTCPGELQCSGHGNCISDDGSFKCECSEGWIGGDCSERLCPKGLSWFAYPSDNNIAHDTYTTCSDMGTCDTSQGVCECHPAFFGQACEYMSCGGGVETPCNGHGRCLTMYELAEWAENNGDATEFTYGKDPNNPYTWDGHRVHGCLCDVGWEGYDCSLRKCPKGDDPGTYDDSVEMQLLRCTADGGTFKLGFRQKMTPALPVDITLEAAQEALITMIGSPVTLSFFDKVSARTAAEELFCQTSRNELGIMMLRFDTVHADLPALKIDNSELRDDTNGDGRRGSGIIELAVDGAGIGATAVSVKGTTENAYCNNRGLCDFSSGTCRCFPNWGSSDGKNNGVIANHTKVGLFGEGNVGDRGDCGFRHQFNSNGGRIPGVQKIKESE